MEAVTDMSEMTVVALLGIMKSLFFSEKRKSARI